MKPYYLYVTPFFPSPTSWRGAVGSDFVAELKRCQRKWQVEVFVPGRGADYDFQGIRVHRFPIRELPSALFPFLFKSFNQRSFLRKVAACGIRPEDVAVCHGNTAFYSIYPLAIKRHNPKCLTLLQHHDLSSFGLTIGRLRHFWPYKVHLFPQLRRLHEQIDCHVFISEACRRSFLAAPDASWSVFDDYRRQMSGLGFYRPAKIKDSIIVHNGVDRSTFYPCEKAEKAGRAEFVIGCVGNFRNMKDQCTLIRAVARVRRHGMEAKIILVGSGEMEGVIRREIDACGMAGAVEFRREVTHDQLADFYRSLDLFVLPSYFEGFGCVYTEAWACGVPFIGVQGQGIEDMLAPEERANWLIEPHDDQRLAELILGFGKASARQNLVCPVYLDEIVPKFAEKVLTKQQELVKNEKA